MSEDEFLQNVARSWGDLLFNWAEQLYNRSGRFRRAVEQERRRRENAPLPEIPPDASLA